MKQNKSRSESNIPVTSGHSTIKMVPTCQPRHTEDNATSLEGVLLPCHHALEPFPICPVGNIVKHQGAQESSMTSLWENFRSLATGVRGGIADSSLTCNAYTQVRIGTKVHKH